VDPENGRETVRAMTLTCSALARIAQPFLFSTLDFYKFIHHLYTLSLPDENKDSIRKAEVEAEVQTRLENVLGRLQYYSSPHIAPHVFQSFLQMTSLESLEARDNGFRNEAVAIARKAFTAAFRCLPGFKNLCQLTLNGISFDEPMFRSLVSFQGVLSYLYMTGCTLPPSAHATEACFRVTHATTNGSRDASVIPWLKLLFQSGYLNRLSVSCDDIRALTLCLVECPTAVSRILTMTVWSSTWPRTWVDIGQLRPAFLVFHSLTKLDVRDPQMWYDSKNVLPLPESALPQLKTLKCVTCLLPFFANIRGVQELAILEYSFYPALEIPDQLLYRSLHTLQVLDTSVEVTADFVGGLRDVCQQLRIFRLGMRYSQLFVCA
jgi:hypothetical protein